MLNKIMWIALAFLIYNVIGWFWQLLELFFYGEIQPRFVDSIIGFVLTASIIINIVQFNGEEIF